MSLASGAPTWLSGEQSRQQRLAGTNGWALDGGDRPAHEDPVPTVSQAKNIMRRPLSTEIVDPA